jgi:hypothetical protein
MTYKKIQEILRCAQILRCLKSKYLLFFPARRVFRYAGMDVNAWSKFQLAIIVLADLRKCGSNKIIDSSGLKLISTFTVSNHETTITSSRLYFVPYPTHNHIG